jgi:CRISPR-associated protein Cas4
VDVTTAMETISHFIARLVQDATSADSTVLLFFVISIACVIVLDAVTLAIGKTKRETGLEPKSVSVSIDGSKNVPVRRYLSEKQALAGRPDALISEDGFIIPVERKPLARKVRDRYVAQLLVYMRLVEEFEGKRPPYGYLILGQSCRKIRIENTPERQAWLQKMLDEMQEILNGGPATATPQEKKCQKCDVRAHCSFASSTGQVASASSKSAILRQRAN